MSNFYVRPAGTVYGNADGSSFNDAWTAFAGVDWTGSGVQPGDTLFVSGEYDETLIIGGSGLEGLPIIIELENAVLNRSTADFDIEILNVSYITVQNGLLLGSLGQTFARSISMEGADNCIISKVTFNGIKDAVRLQMSTTPCTNISFRGCTFFNVGQHPIFIKTEATLTSALVGLEILDCYFEGCSSIQFFYADYTTIIGTNGFRPLKVDINNCYFKDSIAASVIVSGASGTLDNQSYVRNSTFESCGKPGEGLVNTIQTGNNEDLIIENNLITDPYTDTNISAGDGHGIILDFQVISGADVPSKRCIVRGNTVIGAISVTEGAGINIWRGEDTEVYGNICEGNQHGIESQNIDTGNRIYNNTCLNNLKSGFRTTASVTQETIWYNNISLNNSIGFSTGAFGLTESTNCFWGNQTISNFTLTLPIFGDPMLSEDYKIDKDSLIINRGMKFWGENPRPRDFNNIALPDRNINVGAFQV